MKKKKIWLIIIIILVVLLLAASLYLFVLSDDKKFSLNEETTTTTTTKVVQIVDVNSKSRPFAIMVNNVDGARKLQSGLQEAYIIYEMIVEGGITRYLALYLDSDCERIGSIRSARHYYLDYALENDAIYVHHGNSPQALSDFKTLGVDRIEVSNSTGWRDSSASKTYEYTLFTNIEKLKKGLGSKRLERKNDLLLDYTVDEIDLSTYEGAIAANNVSIPYSKGTRNSYVYDAELKLYKRFVNDKEQTDYVTKEQLTFKNIITYKVKNYTLDDPENKGRQGIDNIGKGEGYYITNGYAVPITWEKKSRKDQTVYKFKDGKEIVVNDGNTFIQIQPINQSLTIN